MPSESILGPNGPKSAVLGEVLPKGRLTAREANWRVLGAVRMDLWPGQRDEENRSDGFWRVQMAWEGGKMDFGGVAVASGGVVQESELACFRLDRPSPTPLLHPASSLPKACRFPG